MGKGQTDVLRKFRGWCCCCMLSGGSRENQVERHSGWREQPAWLSLGWLFAFSYLSCNTPLAMSLFLSVVSLMLGAGGGGLG